MSDIWIWSIAIAIIAAAAYLFYRSRSGRPVPDAIRRGRPLPEFSAVDEQGNLLRSTDLRGAPAVLIFVRGNWCPFCNRQVRNLTKNYKQIVDLGARLILVTPKPLETTRRVAEFFEVEFDFWLDESLTATRQLGLLFEGAVPADYRKEYGEDTMWPTSLVIDAAGIIRYVELSKHIIDRPNPKTLLREVQRAIDS
ncbi:MAG: peroxiredoxin family protein [Woeseiaceae bacterium]